MGGSSSAVVVECAVGSRAPDLVLLDTASTFSVIGGATADLLEPDLEETGVAISMSTRYGRLDGHLSRVRIRLIADPGWGANLGVDATILVLPTWPGPIVLGVRGFLNRVRFAVDPGAGTDEAVFFFGATG